MGQCLSTSPASYDFSRRESHCRRGQKTGDVGKIGVQSKPHNYRRAHHHHHHNHSSVSGFRGANAKEDRASNSLRNGGPDGGGSGGGGVVDTCFGFARDVLSKYDFEYEVGRGHFGHTCAAKIRKGERKGERVAIKVIPKAKLLTQLCVDDVKREVSILKSLVGHENIVRFYEALEDTTNVYIVMELCVGGELLDRMLAKGGIFSEKDAIPIIHQMLKILAWCHVQGVTHRDLKPENFLFATRDEHATLKAIDFGLSDFITVDGKLTDVVGSAYYVAPEVLNQSYGVEADVWSVGVICYTLLCGGRPFFARSESGVFDAVMNMEPSFEEEAWRDVSPSGIDFVKKLLRKDSRARMSAVQALCHPWMLTATQEDSSLLLPGNNISGGEVRRGNVPLDPWIISSVRKYSWMEEIGRDACKAMAETMEESELTYQKAQFKLLDGDGDGFISYEDIERTLSSLLRKEKPQPSPLPASASLMAVVESINRKTVERIGFQEFLAASISMEQLKEEGWDERKKEAYLNFSCCHHRSSRLKKTVEPGSPIAVAGFPILDRSHKWQVGSDDRLTEDAFGQILLKPPVRLPHNGARHQNILSRETMCSSSRLSSAAAA